MYLVDGHSQSLKKVHVICLIVFNTHAHALEAASLNRFCIFVSRLDHLLFFLSLRDLLFLIVLFS